MRRIVPAVLWMGVLLAETRRFDLYSFSVPSGYVVRETGKLVELTKKDLVRRTFCQFILQPSQVTLGTAEKDIDAEWRAVVSPAYTPQGVPETVASGDGRVTRRAATGTNGVPRLISSLTVLRFSERYVGVLFNASHAEAVAACEGDAAEILGSIRLSAPPSEFPTGNTPQLFPGSPGWLPSGAGLPIPDAGIVEGKPVGMWWLPQADGSGVMKAVAHVFLEGGIRASNPRLGGPRLFDIEGQQRQMGATGVGTYGVENGQFVQRYDRFENRGTYTTGSDGSGRYFKSGESLFRPVTAVTQQTVAGHWKGRQSEYTFRADGTFSFSSGRAGRYRVKGFLIQLLPDGAAGWIDRVGMGGEFLLLGGTVLTRLP